jgi:hypothetical protein
MWITGGDLMANEVRSRRCLYSGCNGEQVVRERTGIPRKDNPDDKQPREFKPALEVWECEKNRFHVNTTIMQGAVTKACPRCNGVMIRTSRAKWDRESFDGTTARGVGKALAQPGWLCLEDFSNVEEAQD